MVGTTLFGPATCRISRLSSCEDATLALLIFLLLVAAERYIPGPIWDYLGG